MKKLYGVTTAMTTPFTVDGKINLSALEKQVDFLIEKGVHCLYPCGTTGEMYHMNADERKLVAKTVVTHTAGRVTVFIHVGAMSEEETIQLAQHAYQIGADGVGIVTPSYFMLDEREMVEYYKRVCASLPSDFPVYVYVIPQLACNDITPPVMERIAAECSNVIGVKYSFADMRRINDYLRIRNKSFSVVVGADDLFLPCLSCGCDGVVSGCSCAVPEAFVAVYQAFLDGDIQRARKAQETATELAKLMEFGKNMSIFKNILTSRGIPGGYMRKPLLDLADERREALLSEIKRYL